MFKSTIIPNLRDLNFQNKILSQIMGKKNIDKYILTYLCIDSNSKQLKYHQTRRVVQGLVKFDFGSVFDFKKLDSKLNTALNELGLGFQLPTRFIQNLICYIKNKIFDNMHFKSFLQIYFVVKQYDILTILNKNMYD